MPMSVYILNHQECGETAGYLQDSMLGSWIRIDFHEIFYAASCPHSGFLAFSLPWDQYSKTDQALRRCIIKPQVYWGLHMKRDKESRTYK
ncbi:hypothetical protein C5167_023464 [Papaver somniferum]|uniref:Uncharacterized protein n=1 Tax=Papaver somniferum TaxID=3469 RepID=A0A4Y7JKT7_PAPSO|nr:hypothetical protein C5167_023464 [Papaver somniferum]